MAALRVICVKWGDKYGPEWVYRLRSMVSRHLSIPHEFVCMTDQPIEDVECVPCAEDLPGWWAKVGLGRLGLFPGINLYLDLDVVITDILDGLIDDALHPGKLCAPDDFSYSLRNPKQGIGPDMRRLLGGDGTINSSVMVWQDNDLLPIWDWFEPAKMDEVHGDQNWITQAMWPDRIALMDKRWICSYKYHVQRGEPAAPIVVFHGEPKVNQLSRKDPLRQEWEQ